MAVPADCDTMIVGNNPDSIRTRQERATIRRGLRAGRERLSCDGALREGRSSRYGLS